MKLLTPSLIRRLFLLNLSLFSFQIVVAQTDGVLIDYGTATKDNSAVLDVRSATQGFLAPRVVLTATNVAAPITSPASGLLVYNTNATGSGSTAVQPGYYYWSGTGWTRLMSGNTTPLSGSGAATRVAFWSGANSLSSDADLYWDNNTKRLGVGITSPGQLLDVDGTSRFRNTMNFGVTDNEGLISWTSNIGNGEAGLVIRGQTTRGILLGANNGSHMMIDIAGNVGIGTTTGPGQKLDVAGGSIRTTHQLISTIATGTSPMQVSSTTLNTNLNADLLDGWHADELQFQQSGRNFPNGTLIQTDIDYSVTNGEPWLLEIEGNSYGNKVPFHIKIQGYIYSNTVINYGGISNGTNITGISLFNYGGKLCFWFPYQAYWQGYSVYVKDSYSGIKNNRLVSITHEVKPGTITKEVNLSSSIRQSWHSGNFDPTTYTPTTGGTGYIQNQVALNQPAGFRINGNGLFNGGSVGIGNTSPSTKLQVNHTSSGGLTGNSAYGGIHLDQDAGADGFTGITASATSSGTQGGILFQGSGSYGTKIHFMTTNNYSSGMQNRMTLDHTGKLGIATTNPQTLLNIDLGAGGTNSTAAIRIGGTSNYPSLELGIKGNYDGIIRTYGNDLHLYAGHWRTSGTSATENHNLSFYTSQTGSTNWETPKMFLRYDGNVGIGTTSPVSQLEVNGGDLNVSGQGRFKGWYSEGTGLAAEIGISSGQAYIYSYNRTASSYQPINLSGSTVGIGRNGVNTDIFVDAVGEVGINTSAPTQRLDVNGQIRIRGGSPASNKVLTATDANGNATWQTPKSHTSASASTSGTGWKRVAHVDGSAGRGHGKITVYTTGGSYAPRMTTINWNHDWSSDAGITLTSESGASNYWSDVRITDDGTNSFVEVYFTSSVTTLSLLSDNYGYRPAVLYSGTLPAGGGNVRATSKVGRFNAGEDGLYLGFNDRVGIGTGSPAQKLHVAGGTEIEAAAIEGNSTTRIYRNLVSSSWGGGQTGALVIQTNVPQDQHTMTQTWINWKRRYQTGSSNNQIIASGYWSSEGNGGFQGLGYTSQGGEILRVRFMRNSSTGMVAIVIGETNTSWSYPNVSVTKMSAHYGISSDSYADGWTADFSTTLSGLTNSDDVPDVTSLGQGASVYSNATEINLNGNNTGSFSYSAGAGWTPGTWQDVSGFTLSRTVVAGNMVHITSSALVEADNYNYFAPSSAYFRLMRGTTEIARTAVFLTPASYVPSSFWYFTTGNFAMDVVETSVSGSQTYKIQYWLPNESGSYTENIRIGSRRLNVMEINQ